MTTLEWLLSEPTFGLYPVCCCLLASPLRQLLGLSPAGRLLRTPLSCGPPLPAAALLCLASADASLSCGPPLAAAALLRLASADAPPSCGPPPAAAPSPAGRLLRTQLSPSAASLWPQHVGVEQKLFLNSSRNDFPVKTIFQ